MKQRLVGRYWLLTIPENEFEPKLPNGVDWITGQKEQGSDTGYVHWQVLAYLSKASRLSAVKKIFGDKCHAELAVSKKAEEYVHKEETRIEGTGFEFGVKAMKRNSKTDWDKVRENAMLGQFDEIPSDVFMRCYSNIKRVHMDNLVLDDDRPKKVKVYVGSTGVGKSYRAHREAREADGGVYKKCPLTKWWNGYRGEKNVIIDEFVGVKSINLTYLLQWFDNYGVSVETKGGEVPLQAERFWVTSNLHPTEWYPEAHKEHVAALLRRIDIYRCRKDGLNYIVEPFK